MKVRLVTELGMVLNGKRMDFTAIYGRTNEFPHIQAGNQDLPTCLALKALPGAYIIRRKGKTF